MACVRVTRAMARQQQIEEEKAAKEPKSRRQPAKKKKLPTPKIPESPPQQELEEEEREPLTQMQIDSDEEDVLLPCTELQQYVNAYEAWVAKKPRPGHKRKGISRYEAVAYKIYNDARWKDHIDLDEDEDVDVERTFHLPLLDGVSAQFLMNYTVPDMVKQYAKKPAMWICHKCRRIMFVSPCQNVRCGRRKIHDVIGQKYRTWGLFPVPKKLWERLTISMLIHDSLDPDKWITMLSALLWAGVVVVDPSQGGRTHLPNIAANVRAVHLDLKKKDSMFEIVKLACLNRNHLDGSVFFRCPFCPSHLSDDSSTHHKRCREPGRFITLRPYITQRRLILKAGELPQFHELEDDVEVEWANVLLMLGALIVKAGVNADEQFIFTPYDFYDVDFNNECIDPDTAFVEGDQEAMADSD